jgi:hypothetical protein
MSALVSSGALIDSPAHDGRAICPWATNGPHRSDDYPNGSTTPPPSPVLVDAVAIDCAGDVRVQRTGDPGVRLGRGVLVNDRRPRRVVTHAAIRSRVLTPLLAANVFPVWRKSWNLTPIKPTAARASFHRSGFRAFPPTDRSALRPANTDDEGSPCTYSARCLRSSATTARGRPTRRRPALDFGGPATRPLPRTSTKARRTASGTFEVGSAQRPRFRCPIDGSQGCNRGNDRAPCLRCRAGIVRTSGASALGSCVSACVHGGVPPARRGGAGTGGRRDDGATDRSAATDPRWWSPVQGHVLARRRRAIAVPVRQEHRGESHGADPDPRTLTHRNSSPAGPRQRSPAARYHEPAQQRLHLDCRN